MSKNKTIIGFLLVVGSIGGFIILAKHQFDMRREDEEFWNDIMAFNQPMMPRLPYSQTISQAQNQIDRSRYIGTYSVKLPAASGPERVVTLSISDDDVARFEQDYQNNKPSIVKTGKWSVNSDGTLSVTLESKMKSFKGSPEVMSFRFASDGSDALELIDPDRKVWGEAGLVLERDVLMGEQWIWNDSTDSDTVSTETDEKQPFSVEFLAGGKLKVTTDCNRVSASYKEDDQKLTIALGAMTRKHCEGSRETGFLKQLVQVSGYSLEDDQLTLTLKEDAGSMLFTPRSSIIDESD